MYLLDTDILIWVIRGRKEIIEAVSSLKNKSPTCISSLSIAEIYKNIFPEELIKTDDYINQHHIYPVDIEIAKQGGLYWQQHIKTVRNLSIIDCLIAATAKENNLTVVTLNSRHFPMRDIKVINPLAKFSKKRN